MDTLPPDQAKSTLEGAAAVPVTPAVPDVPGYEVQELVGRGGMGKVYRARHVELNRIVALKVMAHEPDDRALTRFHHEAQFLASLQHPNIAQLYSTGVTDGRPYCVQEFVGGGTLAHLFGGRPQDPTTVAGLVETVARAVQHSHDHGILHRDLKPSNVLLTPDGIPKVTDFGLAKLIAPGSADTPSRGDGLTRTGEILGTPGYMPPEQASGVTATLGPMADVYSLGAILYEGLTGRPPFQAAEPLQTLLLVLSMDPVAPRALLPKLPRDLETICLKCLEKSPRKRYATAKGLADDLRRWRAGEPIVARPVGFTERVGKWARRKKAQAALVAVSSLFALVVVLAAVWLFVNNARLTKLNADLEAAKIDLERTNTDLTAAKTESDKSYTLATTALDEIVRDLGLKLNGVPQGEGLMLDVIARSSDLYRQLSEVRPTDGGAVSRHLNALAMRSAYETNYGRHESAARTRQELTATLRRELSKSPDAPDLRMLEMRLAFDAATSAQAEDKADQASAARADFIRLVDRFVEQFPAQSEVHQYQVRKHWLRGFDAAARSDPDSRIAALREAVQCAKQIADPDARYTFHSSSLAQLGMVLYMANRLADADRTFAEAQDVYEGSSKNPRDLEATRAGLAEVKVRRAGIAMDDGRPRDALALYAAAEPILRTLVKDFPLSRSHHLLLAECLFWQGVLYKADEPARCRKLADEAIAVMDAQLRRQLDPTDQATRDNYVRMRAMLPKPDEDK
jgi:serine/threonine-protein kinase